MFAVRMWKMSKKKRSSRQFHANKGRLKNPPNLVYGVYASVEPTSQSITLSFSVLKGSGSSTADFGYRPDFFFVKESSLTFKTS
jgi:hypothetical protein